MYTIYTNELYHHGVKGQKWGVRRYQNSDGSVTAHGKRRYGVNEGGQMSAKGEKRYNKDVKKARVKQDKTDWKQIRKDYKSTNSTGKKIAKTLLLAPVGTHAYNSLRSGGNSRLKSLGGVAIAKYTGPLGAYAISRHERNKMTHPEQYNAKKAALQQKTKQLSSKAKSKYSQVKKDWVG